MDKLRKIAVIGGNLKTIKDGKKEIEDNRFLSNIEIDNTFTKTTLINQNLKFYTNEFYSFLLINILRGLTEEQQFHLFKTLSIKIKNEDHWEEIGQRCSVNTYNFWKDLKEQLKKEFTLIKK